MCVAAEIFCDGLLGIHAEEASQNFPTVQWHDKAEVVNLLLDIFEPGVESDIQNNTAEVLPSTQCPKTINIFLFIGSDSYHSKC
jgi:hypothetical protein